MTRGIVLGAVCAAAVVVGCDKNAVAPPTTGAITLRIITDALAPAATETPRPPLLSLQGRLDAARVRVLGQTNKTLNLTAGPSGFSGTVDGLPPGGYTVVVEGLVASEVDYFGQTPGVQVVAGQNTSAAITFRSFRSDSVADLGPPTAGMTFAARWARVVSAQGYRVEWDKNPAFASAASKDVTDTFTTVTVTDTGTYNVRVRATNGWEPSGRASDAKSIRVVGTPPPLQNGVAMSGLAGGAGSQRYFAIQVPAGQNQLTVGIAGGTGDANLYVRFGSLPASSTPDFCASTSGNPNQCSFSSPPAGAWYIMLHGTAAYSGLSLTAAYASLPPAPTNLTATALSSSRIDLAWVDNATNEDGFRIERCLGAGCTAFTEIATVGPNVTLYANAGLTAGTGYSYQVRAYNVAGNSGYSNTAIVPVAPNGLTATAVSGTQINLAWTDNATNEVGYRLERCSGVGCSNFLEIATVGAGVTTYQNTGLIAGTSYGYRVRAYTAAATSDYSNPASATPPLAPAAPSGLTATPVSGTEIDLAWTDNATNEDGFKIDRCQVVGCTSFLEIATLGANVTTYQNIGLTVGTSYTYRVRAYNVGGSSGPSNAVSATPATVPAAPTRLTAMGISGTQINLVWFDNSSSEDGFRIERCGGAGCTAFLEIATVSANATTYQNTGLTGGTGYSYRVRAYNGAGTSAYTNTAVVPVAPTTLTATPVSGSQIDLAWTDNAPDEDGFRIERCQGLTCSDFLEIATVGANATSYQNSSLAAGTSYSYRVRAYTAAGTSDYSASDYSNTATAVPPLPPVGALTATAVSGSQINLAWQDNISNEDGFRIERCAGAACATFAEIATVGPNVTAYANTGLTAGTGYSYRVRAYNAAGNSGYSNVAVVPVAPTSLTATPAVSGTEIDLAWADNATDEDGYWIEYCAGVACTAFSQIAMVGPNVTAYQSSSLTGGTSYSYRVRAVTATGTSVYSNTATAATSLPAPSTLTATAVSGTQINLAWQDLSSNEDGFRIERCAAAGCATFVEIATVGPNVATYANTGLTAGTGYNYRVRAYNAVGNSGYSNVAVVPVAPTSLTATAVSGTEIDLAWTDNATDEDGFRIEYCAGAGCTAFGEIATVGANVTTYQHFSPASGTSHSYRVRAYTATGTSVYSNTATAVIPLPAPANLTATAVSGSQINLAWQDLSGNEDGFRIEQCAGAGCATFAEIATVGPNVTTYANTGLTAGTGYNYRVRASNGVGNSGYSNTAVVPVAPTSLTATAAASGTEIDLAWTDNATNEEGFRIEYCAGVGCTSFFEIAVVGANVTSYQHFSPASGTSHSYRVRAYTTTGTSVYTNTAAAVIPLPAPGTLTATAVAGTQINLAWQDLSSNEDGFRIERCAGAGCATFAEIATVGPNVTTYANAGVTAGTGYSYRVRAYNGVGNSGYSNVAVVPVAPTSLTATAAVSGTEIDLAWTDNATNEDGFRIEYCAGVGCTAFGEIAVVGANVTTYRHFSPAAGTSHSYRVRAYTATGTSVYSNTAVAVIPLPAPATLTATAVSGTQINLAWQDLSGNEDGFRIERCAGAGCTSFVEIATVGPNVTTYANAGVTAGTAYNYRVRAYNAVGNSDYSNVAVVPLAPTSLTATAAVSGTEIDLAWTDNATNEEGFRIEYCAGVGCTAFGEIATVGTNVTTYQHFSPASGTSHSYRVRAYTTTGTSVYSNTAAAVIPLPAPANLTATAVSGSQISLAWQDLSGNEDGFRIERCFGAGCTNFFEIATVAANVTTYANTGLTLSGSYNYRVRAYNVAGTSAYSNTATATNSMPVPPTNLTATTVSSGQIDLAWTDNATNEDGFRIERCQGVGCTTFTEITTVGANVTTYQNTALTLDISYSYRVRAYNAAGTSSYSNTATATTMPPAAPTTLTATPVSGSQINLAWQDNASNEAGFRIEQCQGAGCTAFVEIATVGANVTSYQSTGLTLGTSYTYQVRAYNAAGTSGYSNPATAIPHELAAPTNLVATTVSASEIDLAWTDNSDNEDGFRIERCSGAGCTNFFEIATVGANVTTYHNTSLLAATSYSYRVRAYNGAGTSAYSNVATATNFVPTQPTNLTATTVSASQIDLAWTDNATNEDGFRIERCAGAGCAVFTEIATVGANVTTYQNTGLAFNTSYTYRVRAYNGAGTSAYTNTATATTMPPAAPTNLTATPVSGSQINLAWQDNASNEAGFRIEQCQGAGCTAFVEIATVGANVTSYQSTGLTLGTSYTYQVRAYNAAGTSGYSNPATAIPHELAAPTNLVATTVSASEIDLAWTDNSDNEDGFRIERCSGAGCTNFFEIATVGANVTTYHNTSLLAATSYSYRVRAYNGAGTSAYSNVATATNFVPTQPTNLTATTVSASQIDLAWTDNATNEDGFRIERCAGAGCAVFTEIATVGANVTTYQNTGLAFNTSYTYRVRAYNGAGPSAYSNTATATTPPCNCWSTRTSMPTPRSGLAAGVVNGTLYAVGGNYTTGPVEAYDPITDMWRTKAPLPTWRYGLGVGIVNGILYAVGGYSGGAVGTLEAYDPVTDTWTTRASMPTARYYVAAGVVNGILYAVGGAGAGGGVIGTVEAYDPSTDTWTTKASLPTARYGVGVGVVNGILYAVGGFSAAGSALMVVDAYDPATDTWTRKASMPTARGDLAVGVVNGILYAVGGSSPSPTGTALATLEAYDPATDTWTTKPSMPTARTALAAGVFNGILYAVGGYVANSLATLEVYQP